MNPQTDRIGRAFSLLGVADGEEAREAVYVETLHGEDRQELRGLPPDMFGHLLTHIPALRHPDLFEAAFGITRCEAILLVRAHRECELEDEVIWRAWSLAMLIVDLADLMGGVEAVNTWLETHFDPGEIDPVAYLKSPIGHDLLREKLKLMKH